MRQAGRLPAGAAATQVNFLHLVKSRAGGLVRLPAAAVSWLMAVPIRIKISGIVLLPVLMLGVAIYLWVRSALSDWLSWLLSAEQVDAAMQAGGRSVLLVTVLALTLSLLLSSALILLLTRPLLELKRIADQVRGGALDRRAPVSGGDEIGQVATSFNRMLDELVHSQRELERSNRRLGSLLGVASSVGRDLELSAVLEAALESTLDAVELESGWIYLKQPDTDNYFLANAIKPPPGIAESPWSLPPDLCSCQRALIGEEDWTSPSVRECLRFSQADNDAQAHHLSVPLKARGLNIGVLNLRWSGGDPPGTDTLELLDAIGVQVSEAVANAQLHSDLLQKEAGMEILLHSLATAQENERSLISGELHDGAGQELTSVLLRLRALETKDDIPALHAGISELCGSLSEAIEHLRELSHQLRPPDLEQLGLDPTLHNLTGEMLSQSGIDARFESNLEGRRLDPTTEITLYRIAQEAITNITRHANAETASVRLLRLDDGILMEIADDGSGFDPDAVLVSGSFHLGLASIQERVERLEGSFRLHTAPGHGTRLEVKVPFSEVYS